MVARERSRLGRVVALWGGALAVGAAAAVLAAGALTLGGGRWLSLPAIVPFVAWLVAAAAVGGLATWTLRRLARDVSTTRVAAAIEQERRLRAGALRGALEVADTGSLGRRGARDLGARLNAAVPRGRSALAPRLRQGAVRRAGTAAAVAVVAVGTLSAAARTVPDGWSAVVHPVRAWRGTLLPPLRIEAPVDVPRGHEAGLRVAAPGRQRVAVYLRSTGSPWTGGWYPVSRGFATLSTGPVAAAVMVVATDGRTTSDTLTVRASDRPFVGSVALRAIYPTYLHRADEALPAGEVARVPRGTRIEITGRASTDLRSVALFHGGDTVALRPDGRDFAGRLLADLPAEWTWRAVGSAGPISDVPPAIQLDVVPDSAPRVEIISPNRDTVVTVGDRIPVSIGASDDHALASVILRSWRTPGSGGALPEVVQPVSDSAVSRWVGVVTLDLGGRGLQPGDAMHVVAQATDGSPWHQMGQSRDLVLRVPSLSEQRQIVRATADSTVAGVTAAAAAQRQLQQQTEEAARERGSRSGASGSSASGSSPRSGLSYQAATRAKSLAAQQRDLSARIDSLQRQAQELERQLKQAGALDSGLAARLHEAQQLLRDALTPEMRDQLSRLDQSADSLRGGDTRQSLSELAQQQQHLREQLDRSVGVLKRAALEGAMQTLRDEARDLAKQERSRAGTSPPNTHDNPSDRSPNASRSGEHRSPSDSASALARSRSADSASGAAEQQRQTDGGDSQPSRDQAARSPASPNGSSGSAQPAGARQSPEQLTERSRALSHDVDQLSKRLAAEKAPTGAQRVGAARQHVDSSTQAMSGRDAPAAAGQMDQAAQQLGDARQAQIDEWKSALTSELDRSIQETMQLGRQESDLAQRAQQGGDRASLQAEQSAVQQGTERASERLQRASQQSALVSGNSQRAVGQARNQVQAATRDAQQTTPGSSGQQQTASSMRAAADALNQAAASLVRDRERAASASSASGLSEMLQEMQDLAKGQASLNARAQGLSLMPGGQPGGANGQGARALADGQRRLADSLERLGEGDASGRAQGLAAEAHQIADALDRSGIDQQTLIRQQRLYHRLLDAGHTLEQDERDSSAKRVSQSATGREQFTPPTAPVTGKSATRYQEPSWSELRGLSADERQLVIDYFKRLNADAP